MNKKHKQGGRTKFATYGWTDTQICIEAESTLNGGYFNLPIGTSLAVYDTTHKAKIFRIGVI